MKCDKCGFEHNSKSVCPKCGARVVYIDEDYLRRRKEWEEAQRNGQTDVKLPTDIIHSTREEYDEKKGRGGPKYTQGKSESIGPYLAALKRAVIKFVAAIITFFIKHFKKKRGANNPVIRGLKFDDKPETLDNSKLVLSHRVFKDKRKPIIIGLAVIVIIAAVSITVVNIILHIDNSEVLIFNGKSAYYASDTSNILFESDEDVIFTEVSQGCFLGYNSLGIYIVKGSEAAVIEASNPEIITYNETLDSVVYKTDDVTMLYNGESTVIDGIDEGVSYTSECTTSPDGKYIALTAYEYSKYTLFYINNGVTEAISQDDMEKNILSLTNDGTMIYLNMQTAEYGIINDKSLMLYNGRNNLLAENVDDARVIDGNIFYISDDGRLYTTTVSDYRYFTLADDEVTDFALNALSDDELYYQKAGTYCMWKDGVTTALFRADSISLTLYYNTENTYLYAADMNSVSYAAELGNSQITQILDTSGMNPVYIQNEDCLLVTDTDGQLYRLADDYSVIYDNISAVTEIIGGDGYAFIKDNVLYMKKTINDKSIKLYDTNTIDKIIFSDKNFYFTDDNNDLYKISAKGKEQTSLGYAIDCYFVD